MPFSNSGVLVVSINGVLINGYFSSCLTGGRLDSEPFCQNTGFMTKTWFIKNTDKSRRWQVTPMTTYLFYRTDTFGRVISKSGSSAVRHDDAVWHSSFDYINSTTF